MEKIILSEIFIYTLLVIVAICFLVQLYYYLFIYLKVAFAKDKLNNMSKLSVLICIRNEANNLRNNLPKILEQDFNEYEVIVVDDCSTDDSQDILKEFAAKYSNLEIRRLQIIGLTHSKHIVIGVGIKAAKYEHILLTDANCRPTSKNWLTSLTSGLDSGKEIVISYTRTSGRWFYRADRFIESIGELGFALKNKPYTNNGENIIFNSKLFFDNNGFKFLLNKNEKAEKIFFNSIMTPKNTSVSLNNESINKSSLSLNFKNWKRDKKNAMVSLHLFKSGKYKRTIEITSRIIFILGVILLAYSTIHNQSELWIIPLSLLFLRMLVQVIVFFKIQKKVQEKGLLLFSILWDLLSPIAYSMAFLTRKSRG